jgi:hypothetical protein
MIKDLNAHAAEFGRGEYSDCVTSGAVALIGTADFQWDNQKSDQH